MSPMEEWSDSIVQYKGSNSTSRTSRMNRTNRMNVFPRTVLMDVCHDQAETEAEAKFIFVAVIDETVFILGSEGN